MDENILNMAIRRFLKEVGVTSQRAIEIAVRRVLAENRLEGREKRQASRRSTGRRRSRHEVTGEITVG